MLPALLTTQYAGMEEVEPRGTTKGGLGSGGNSELHPNQRMANPVQPTAVVGIRVGKQWDGRALA